ncbi:hypothetical protein E2C01_035682 [Portunus trituberculatus]|uniref:Uncharacterized protein n=1 Tax=Portunus trituberculatus TaxID=210409 RepID=A0A5B7FAE3_PORTR|nr:hypothetical protein [Portunus trituberculatus]
MFHSVSSSKNMPVCLYLSTSSSGCWLQKCLGAVLKPSADEKICSLRTGFKTVMLRRVHGRYYYTFGSFKATEMTSRVLMSVFPNDNAESFRGKKEERFQTRANEGIFLFVFGAVKGERQSRNKGKIATPEDEPEDLEERTISTSGSFKEHYIYVACGLTSPSAPSRSPQGRYPLGLERTMPLLALLLWASVSFVSVDLGFTLRWVWRTGGERKNTDVVRLQVSSLVFILGRLTYR